MIISGQKNPYLTKPLVDGKEINIRNDSIAYSDIIGKQVRDSVETKKKGTCPISWVISIPYLPLTLFSTLSRCSLSPKISYLGRVCHINSSTCYSGNWPSTLRDGCLSVSQKFWN